MKNNINYKKLSWEEVSGLSWIFYEE